MLGIYIILIAFVVIIIGKALNLSARHAQPDGRTDTSSRLDDHTEESIHDPVLTEVLGDWDVGNPLSYYYQLDSKSGPLNESLFSDDPFSHYNLFSHDNPFEDGPSLW